MDISGMKTTGQREQPMMVARASSREKFGNTDNVIKVDLLYGGFSICIYSAGVVNYDNNK